MSGNKGHIVCQGIGVSSVSEDKVYSVSEDKGHIVSQGIGVCSVSGKRGM